MGSTGRRTESGEGVEGRPLGSSAKLLVRRVFSKFNPSGKLDLAAKKMKAAGQVCAYQTRTEERERREEEEEKEGIRERREEVMRREARSLQAPWVCW